MIVRARQTSETPQPTSENIERISSSASEMSCNPDNNFNVMHLSKSYIIAV